MTHPTALDDFIAKVDVAWNGCWLWTGTVRHGGYGAWDSHPEYSRRAHRAAWELLVGPIPDGLHIDHLCRVPGCVNPDHLEPVTREENTRRGYGWTAQNERKTHCAQGHPLSGSNIYPITPKSRRYGRRCRTCNRARVAASTARRKARLAQAG